MKIHINLFIFEDFATKNKDFPVDEEVGPLSGTRHSGDIRDFTKNLEFVCRDADSISNILKYSK